VTVEWPSEGLDLKIGSDESLHLGKSAFKV